MSTHWTRLATANGIILRASIAGGKRGEPVVVMSGLRLTPPQPLATNDGGALLQRIRWQSPHQAKECYVVGHHGIRNGDTLVAGDKSYTVRNVGEWEPPAGSVTAITHLVLEDLLND